MSKYILRLDDACEKRDIDKWGRIEKLCDIYNVKPLVGIIPNCQDPEMDKYKTDETFWSTVECWIDKGWTVAMHGYNHVYRTDNGGINPVNSHSEFAGLSVEEQKRKIRKGVDIFFQHNIVPKVFFAPSHTFDENTLEALRACSQISVISDTVSSKPYSKYGFTFVPVQAGAVRRLPCKVITFCYHPNTMNDYEFGKLENFLIENYKRFIEFPSNAVKRKLSIFDKLLSYLYFARR